MTKVRILQPCDLKRLSRVVNPGEELEMTPDEVKEFCDKKFVGPYKHDGFASKKNARRSMIARAIRMTDVEAIERANQIAAGSQVEQEDVSDE
jgi:hypothetical protein